MQKLVTITLCIFSWQVYHAVHNTHFDSLPPGTNNQAVLWTKFCDQCCNHLYQCCGLWKRLLHGLWRYSKHHMCGNLPNKCSWNLHFPDFSYILELYLDCDLSIPHLAPASRSPWCLWVICPWLHHFMDICLPESSWNKRHAFRSYYWIFCSWCKTWYWSCSNWNQIAYPFMHMEMIIIIRSSSISL